MTTDKAILKSRTGRLIRMAASLRELSAPASRCISDTVDSRQQHAGRRPATTSPTIRSTTGGRMPHAAAPIAVRTAQFVAALYPAPAKDRDVAAPDHQYQRHGAQQESSVPPGSSPPNRSAPESATRKFAGSRSGDSLANCSSNGCNCALMECTNTRFQPSGATYRRRRFHRFEWQVNVSLAPGEARRHHAHDGVRFVNNWRVGPSTARSA